MTRSAAAALASWEPILTGIRATNELSVQFARYAENTPLAREIVGKISRLHGRLDEYSKGFQVTYLHPTTANMMLEEIENAKARMAELASTLIHGRVSASAHGGLSEELDKIDGSIEFLKTKIYTFGLCVSVRRQLEDEFELLDEIYGVVPARLKRFIEVYNANARNDDVGVAMESLSRSQSQDDEYRGREIEQVNAVAHIPDLLEEANSLDLQETHKLELVKVLKSAESSWMCSVDSFSIDKVNGRDYVLSSGGFKTVYRGSLKVRNSEEDGDFTTVPVAVLQYNIGPSGLAAMKGSIWREILMAWKISHRCIVKTHGAFWPKERDEGDPPKIFCELMTHDLRNGKHEKALENPETRFSIAVDVAEGLYYLHSRRIVHRDLKPENVLLRIDGDELVSRAKLCDFGASREMRTTALEISRRNELTPLYAPPEEFSGGESTYAYDIWSYGLILCWLDGDESKAPVASRNSMWGLVQSGELLRQSKEWAASIGNEVLRKCAEECIRDDPQERGTICDILRTLKAEAAFADADKPYMQRDYDRTVALSEWAAGQGHASAQNNFGMMSYNGKGVRQDSSRAEELIREDLVSSHDNFSAFFAGPSVSSTNTGARSSPAAAVVGFVGFVGFGLQALRYVAEKSNAVRLACKDNGNIQSRYCRLRDRIDQLATLLTEVSIYVDRATAAAVNLTSQELTIHAHLVREDLTEAKTILDNLASNIPHHVAQADGSNEGVNNCGHKEGRAGASNRKWRNILRKVHKGDLKSGVQNAGKAAPRAFNIYDVGKTLERSEILFRRAIDRTTQMGMILRQLTMLQNTSSILDRLPKI